MRPALLTLGLAVLLWPAPAGAQSVSDSDFLAIEPHETTVFVNADTQFTTAIVLNNATPLGTIVIPLSFSGLPELSIDTTVVTAPNIKGVTFGPAGSGAIWTIRSTHRRARSAICGGMWTSWRFSLSERRTLSRVVSFMLGQMASKSG